MLNDLVLVSPRHIVSFQRSMADRRSSLGMTTTCTTLKSPSTLRLSMTCWPYLQTSNMASHKHLSFPMANRHRVFWIQVWPLAKQTRLWKWYDTVHVYTMQNDYGGYVVAQNRCVWELTDDRWWWERENLKEEKKETQKITMQRGFRAGLQLHYKVDWWWR